MKKGWIMLLMVVLGVMPLATVEAGDSGNEAFRDVGVSEPRLEMRVSGKAKLPDGMFEYRVSDGYDYLVRGRTRVGNGSSEWKPFVQWISVAKEQVNPHRTLTLELVPMDHEETDSLVVDLKKGEKSGSNPWFRDIRVSEPVIHYEVTGEARVSEGTVHYTVEDGHDILAEGSVTASAGTPEWGSFTEDIRIPQNRLPANGTLILVLFEKDDDGSHKNSHYLPIDRFPW
ncbi:Gmad2 immunoglobulin-like domain-containing protein [Desmospora profundinema]|uniref:Bacterial spore germination immunoglobulin-like domain-containing protein n=1 Tax=Desmospora profundinema TaxID=1571184 RepID=A0ABU1IK67_9BACL|nr:Gmad2 immunoglobulin-like domain-containing protein [Desmospora profundinema]MDR6224778.1 hypothetical protein [Desmospora profundinema]